jgi:translocation and assembly module TamA
LYLGANFIKTRSVKSAAPWIFSFLILLAGAVPAVAADGHRLCDHIFLKEGRLKLNDNEKVLVCGSDKGGEGWQEVPVPQAQMQLANLFQAAGYLNPRFEREGDHLNVWSGPQSDVKSLAVNGDPGVLRPEKKRKIIGYPLMPSKLNEVQRWGDQELRSHGYACPAVKVEAHAWDESLLLNVNPGSRQRVGELTYTGLEGLHVDTLLRYRAFDPGEVYDIRDTQLTSDRLLADGLFQSAYYVVDCQGEVVNLQLRSSVGKAKIFRFGVGASTEEFPFMDISFRNARLDDRASSFSATLHASNILQSFELRSQLYWFIGLPRIYFGPRFRTERQSENVYEALLSKAGADLGMYWDLWDLRFNGRFGPTVNYTKTVRGIGPSDATYTSLEGSLSMQSHVYELFYQNQYDGWSGNFQFRGNRKGLGSDISVNRYDANFKYLWNIGAYAPPLFVLGARVEGSVVAVDEEPGKDVRSLLPVDYRIFYGGDDNLRGFARKSIDNGGAGYLTSLYTGFELRLVEQIPYGVQPLILWDAARMGDRAQTLDAPVYVSEGFGVRWATPFGSLRGSAARGKIWGGDATTAAYAQQWIYFVSFGQEF